MLRVIKTALVIKLGLHISKYKTIYDLFIINRIPNTLLKNKIIR